MYRLYPLIITILCCLCVNGQGQHSANTPSFDAAITTPAVPEKQAPTIRQHMKAVDDALRRLKFNTERVRNKEVIKVVIPSSELFSANSTSIKAQSKGRLDNFGKFLKYPTMYKLVVAVFTDNTGEPAYLEALSKARASAIGDYMLELGFKNEQSDINVSTHGMGASHELEPNTNMDNRATNRRVEIYIIPEWQMIETARLGKLN